MQTASASDTRPASYAQKQLVRQLLSNKLITAQERENELRLLPSYSSASGERAVKLYSGLIETRTKAPRTRSK